MFNLWFDTENNFECISGFYIDCIDCDCAYEEKCKHTDCEAYNDFNQGYQYIYYEGEIGSSLMGIIKLDIHSLKTQLMDLGVRYIKNKTLKKRPDITKNLYSNIEQQLKHHIEVLNIVFPLGCFTSYFKETYGDIVGFSEEDERETYFELLKIRMKNKFKTFECILAYIYSCIIDTDFYDIKKLNFAGNYYFGLPKEIQYLQINLIDLEYCNTAYYEIEKFNDSSDFIDDLNKNFTSQKKYYDERFKLYDKVYYFDSLEDFALIELHEIFKAGYKFKKCKNCGIPFIPYNRSDTMYCNRAAPQDYTKTCKEYGGRKSYQENLKTSKSKGLYRKIYMAKQMLAQRNSDIKEYQKDFEKYKTNSKKWKADVKSGVKTEEEFIEWLESVKGKKHLG